MKNIRKCKKWHILAYISVLGLLFACADHMLQEGGNPAARRSKHKNEELTISAARQWYESNYAPVVTTRANASDPSERLMRPLWDKAKESNRRRYEVVEIPIQTKGHHIIVDAETAMRWKPGDKADFIRNTARFVVLYDKKTKKIQSFVMIFVGSYDYLRKTHSMGRNSYLYREPDFDGSVLFYSLNGTFSNGWKYSEGKIIATISPKPAEELEEESSVNTRVLVPECYEDCYTYYDEWCYEEGFVEEDPEYGLGFGVVAGCIPVSYQDCKDVCYWYDDGTSDDDTWDTSYPNGGVDDNQQTTQQDPQQKPQQGMEQDPCSKSQLMSGDSNFRSQVDKFFDDNLTATVENGWMKTKTGEYVYPDIREGNAMNYSSSLTSGKVFTEQYHCHPASTGQSCIPSQSDLRKMAFYYQKGRIDVANYSYGVISDVGCISIIITSETQFAAFAKKVYNASGATEPVVNQAWKEYVTGVVLGTPEASVGKLINFFKETNAGLSVMFRTMSSGNKGKHQSEHWSAKDVNANGSYSDKNCN